MRHYADDSPPAVARVLSLALMADGAIDASEIESLRRSRVLDRFGIAERAFDRVMREFCEDLSLSVDYIDVMQCRLEPALIDSLLDEIKDSARRRVLLDTMLAISVADGTLSDGERRLLARAAVRWGEDSNWPVRICPLAVDA